MSTIELNESHHDFYDRKPFITNHNLMGHPLLTMESLGELVQRLPQQQVYFSSAKVSRDADFDRAWMLHRPRMSLADAVKDFANAEAYIMVRSPETDPEYQPLFKQILADVEQYTRARDPHISNAMLYLFISSPNSTTPFHIDRYTTFLMQFEGSKKVYTWAPTDRETVPEEALETIFAEPSQRMPLLSAEHEAASTEHFLPSGSALHIPFIAPHWVKNGDAVSISMSIIFRSRRTDRVRNTYIFNSRMRKRLKITPRPVGRAPWIDSSKATLESVIRRFRQ
jgi:ribosomal protein L16 Arg81 hydroxylase